MIFRLIIRTIDIAEIVLRSTRHKIGHFGNVPQANLLAWYGKTKPHATRAQTNVLQHKINTKKLKLGLVASYDSRPGNGEGPFWFQRFINVT